MPPDPRWTPETETLITQTFHDGECGGLLNDCPFLPEHKSGAVGVLTALADAHLLVTPARPPYVPPRTGWYRNTFDGLVYVGDVPPPGGGALHIEVVDGAVHVTESSGLARVIPPATWVILPWTRIHTGEAS
jgi:hypothetical protein